MRFLGFVLAHRDEFAFLWEEDPQLRELAIETFERDVSDSAYALRSAITDISNEALAIHGLVGRPAKFKFEVLNTVADQWDTIREQTGRIRGWFKRTAKAIDVILDSLGAAAGGIGGVLKEFKDTMEVLSESDR